MDSLSVDSLSIVIPTHNRPRLLEGAIESALRSYDNIAEILVIDDASDPPVDVSELQRQFGDSVRVHRNEQPQGIARVRVLGGEIAKGRFMFQLDDDDLLAPGSLTVAMAALKSANVDILYVAVEGFGERAEAFNSGQGRSVSRLIDRAEGYRVKENLLCFNNLFPGLLKGAPSAFQHPLALTETWRKVNDLRFSAFKLKGVLQPEHADNVEPMTGLLDPLNESEWALYAAAKWAIGFLEVPVYRARCEGIRNYSVPHQRDKQQDANRLMKKRLYLSSKYMDELRPWRSNILSSYTQLMFDAAYYYFYSEGNRTKAWTMLFKSARISFRLYMIKFFLRTLLPLNLGVRAGS